MIEEGHAILGTGKKRPSPSGVKPPPKTIAAVDQKLMTPEISKKIKVENNVILHELIRYEDKSGNEKICLIVCLIKGHAISAKVAEDGSYVLLTLKQSTVDPVDLWTQTRSKIFWMTRRAKQ